MAFEPDEKFDFLFKIVLIGDAGIGKTCIVQRFKSGNYVERQGSTIGVDFTMKTLVIDKKRIKVCGALLLFSNGRTRINIYVIQHNSTFFMAALQLQQKFFYLRAD